VHTFFLADFNSLFCAEVSATVAAEELNSLEDLYLAEEEVVEAHDEDFLVALRLSPEPVHLVKGYEFKMLNKYTQPQLSPPSLSFLFPLSIFR
jgi:hypothetical protein